MHKFTKQENQRGVLFFGLSLILLGALLLNSAPQSAQADSIATLPAPTASATATPSPTATPTATPVATPTATPTALPNTGSDASIPVVAAAIVLIIIASSQIYAGRRLRAN